MDATADRLVLFLVPHLYLTVFVASAVDAVGIPFPGRILLVLAGAFASSRAELALAIVASALGSLLGDHVVYLAGTRRGDTLLALYCRLTLGSERCVENIVKYFRRFGAAAIVLGRYSTGVRLFAAILSGTGRIPYRRFLLYDLAGSLAYAAVWVVLGRVFGDEVEAALEWLGRQRALFLIVPTAIAAIVGYRLWRRRRHGAARAEDLCGPPESGRNRILR
ncbi:MAG TPA: DedA family protein [Methylomirabilota bacterium]|nr:DedA family protein [Methylomirabilota bacterium]